MGGRKGCKSIIHDPGRDLWVTMVGWGDVPDNERGDFIRDKSSYYTICGWSNSQNDLCNVYNLHHILLLFRGWGGDFFLRRWSLWTVWAGPLILITGDVWIIPSFRMCGYVLHVEHVSWVITNCGQYQWVTPSPLSVALWALLNEDITIKLLSPSLDMFFKILLFQVAFLIFFPIAIFSPYFLLVGLLLTCALRRSIVLQLFWHVDTRPILPFLFFFNSTFYLCIIIVTFYLMYLIH